jgi:aminoglycoside phosphotransferase (APT) family kinase protein
MLARRRSALAPELARRLELLFHTMAQTLAATTAAPRYVHGDCHAHQFFVVSAGADLLVSGVVDMEVASAGAPVEDLVKFILEVATVLPAKGPLMNNFLS